MNNDVRGVFFYLKLLPGNLISCPPVLGLQECECKMGSLGIKMGSAIIFLILHKTTQLHLSFCRCTF